MKTAKGRQRIFLAAAAIGSGVFSARGEVKMFRGRDDTTSFPGGTWDFNNTARWLGPGSAALLPWTDAGDIALIVNYTGAWDSVTMTIDDSSGPVEAAGIVITNGMKEWQHNFFNDSPLHVGADGVTVHTDTPNTFVDFNCPVVLTAPQTWRNAKVRPMDVSGTVTLAGALSSAPGVETPITFDGFNRVDPSRKGMSLARTVFGMSSDNTYRGATTVRNGGVLYLIFSPDFPGPKLDPAGSLILRGGGLAITGQAQAFTQAVARVVVGAGENFIGGKNANAVFQCGEIVREGIGGTISWYKHLRTPV